MITENRRYIWWQQKREMRRVWGALYAALQITAIAFLTLYYMTLGWGMGALILFIYSRIDQFIR